MPSTTLIDFHVHTPASGDFMGPGDVMAVLKTALSEGIHAVVLTDHNTIDGYLSVVGELEAVAPLVVLPGVEVTCRGGAAGIHVLGVFDEANLGSRPRRLLARLGLGQHVQQGQVLERLLPR